jgi:hypothetical protein
MKDVEDSTKTPAQKALYAKACEIIPLIDEEFAGQYKDYVVRLPLCFSHPPTLNIFYTREGIDPKDMWRSC